MKDWSNYQNRTYNGKVDELLIEFCNNYRVKNAVDLGCGSGNESVYLLNQGIDVTCIDRQLNESYVLNRLIKNQCGNVNFIESDFENVIIPKAELLIAFFSIPFCSPDKFNSLWDKIYDSIEPNGYFVGQLFGDRDGWSIKDNINTFTREQAKEYLKRYNIIKFEEIEYIRKSDNKKWHFYNVIAQKNDDINE